MGITVMLAEEYTLVRKGIRALLETDDTVKVVEEAKNRTEVIEKLNSRKEAKCLPGVLLLDFGIYGKESVRILKEIRSSMPEVRVLFFTRREGFLPEELKAAADGFLSKDAEPHELRRAVKILAEGGRYCRTEPEAGQEREYMDKLDLLTPRERQILYQTAEGKLNKEIADYYKISEQTVKNHLSNIYRKIDVADRTQAAIFAINSRGH